MSGKSYFGQGLVESLALATQAWATVNDAGNLISQYPEQTQQIIDALLPNLVQLETAAEKLTK